MKAVRLVGSLVGLIWFTSTVVAVDPDAIRQAVDRGSNNLRRMQSTDGNWQCHEIGGTALAALTLLECGAAKDDRAVLQAASYLRKGSVNCTQTYSLALSILFFDRLGDPGDAALIEALAVRLMAGQNADGGWGYKCPNLSLENAYKLATALKARNELTGRSKLPAEKKGETTKSPAEKKNDPPKTPNLPSGDPLLQMPAMPLIQKQQLELPSDNSNTQFATLAMWVARRQALPVEQPLSRVEKRFRGTQGTDGGWNYMAGWGRSTATMTCAGVLGLAVAHGAANALAKDKDPKARPVSDAAKDRQLATGLAALASAIGNPSGKKGAAMPAAPPAMAGGKAFYFLWSLERVAMALDLETIGGKDWYGWGSEILLASQRADGSWQGDYGTGGHDTCFALLFLMRANLAKDLTANLRGKINDDVVLRAGGRSGQALRVPPPGTKSGNEAADSRVSKADPKPMETRPTEAPKPADDKRIPVGGTPAPTGEAGQLARDLIKSRPSEQDKALRELREGKGTPYTEALAFAIPQLDSTLQRKARQALADRLTRMKGNILALYLKDEDAEIRRAAALACAMKDSKDQVPHLIPLLEDPELTVVRAAHIALKELSGQTLGPTREVWQDWWDKRTK